MKKNVSEPLPPVSASLPTPPFNTLLAELPMITLASALLIRDDLDGLVFATHDDELGTAARATGFQVHGMARGI